MKSNLKKGIIIVFLANIVNLFFNLLTNLILPKNLSIESYASIKTYQLYMSYIGILHLGYNDGKYLKYGGKRFEDIDSNELASSISILRIYMLFVMIVGIIISLILKNYILLAVFIAMFPTNMLSYFQFLYQACGEFKLYGRVLNYISIGTFIINALLIYFFKIDTYTYYLLFYIILNMIIWIFIEKMFVKIIDKFSFSIFSLKELLLGMKEGVLLTLGNFSSVIMTTMDRWFVKIFIDTVAFAQYSFAVSMENFLNVAITPITVTLYNHFCNNDDSKENGKIKNLVLMFAVSIIVAAYPIKFILETYLFKYYDSFKVIFLLFSSQIFYILIKSIYVNLYKARKMQKKYFRDLIIVIIFGIITNYIGFHMFGTKEAFAAATLCTSIFWLVLCQIYYKDLTIKNYMFIALELSIFLVTGFYLKSYLGFLVYIISTIVLMWLLMNTTLMELINQIIIKFTKVKNSKEIKES